MSERALGILIVATSAICWSTAGIFIRMLDEDVWTVIGWRAFFASIAMGLTALALRNGRKSFGGPGIAAVVLIAVSSIAFIAALKATTVANVYAIYATLPFFAGGIAFLVLGERMPRRLVLASLVALAGVVLVAGALPRPMDILGNALALLMTSTFAGLVVMSRRFPTMDLPLVNALGTLLTGLAVLPLMSTTIPEAHDLVVLAAFGLITTAGAFVLFMIGSRMIPSAEAGLVGLLDVPLAPLWVWLMFAEQPPATVLAGGALILAATVWCLWPRRAAREAAA